MKSKFYQIAAYLVTILFCSSSVVLADDASMMARISSLEKTMTQMQRVIDRQNDKISSLEAPKMRDEGDYVAAPKEMPKWLDDLKFSGDFRLRYEARTEHGAANAPDRNRFRYRLRYGFEKKWEGGPFHEDDVMKVGFRLASAAAGARDSTNTTLDGVFNFDSISINRAYATYIPGWAKWTNDDGLGLTKTQVTAGKFKNPFRKGSTYLMWDSDIEPEGIYEQFEIAALKSEDLDIKNTTTFGQLIIDEDGSGGDHRDSELYAFQTVFETKMKGLLEDGPIKMKNALSTYIFEDFGLDGNFGASGNNTLAPTGTGTVLERSFLVWNWYNEIAFPFQLHKAKGWKIYTDWLINSEGAGNEGQGAEEDYAWMVGTKIGKAKKKGTWELKYDYVWIGANASPDVINDSDFGGTDRRGSVIKAAYALTDNLKLKAALFRTDRLQGDDNERALWQFDLVWKF